MAAEEAPLYLPGRWGALALLCCISSLITGGLIAALSVYTPIVIAAEHWTPVVLGSAGTALLLGISLAGIGAGYALERWRARLVIGVGVLLVAAGCWLAAVAHQAPLFVAGFAIVGIGAAAATTVPSVPLITSYFQHKRALGMGLYIASMAAAAAGLPLLISALMARSGWRVSLEVTGGAVLLTLLLLPFLREPPAVAEGAGEGVKGLTVREAFSTIRVWRLTLAILFSQFSIQAVLFTSVSYFADGGFPMERAVYIYSAANLFTVPGVITMGAVADRFGAGKILLGALVIQALATLAALGVFLPGMLGLLAVGVYVVGWGVSSSVQLQIGPILLRELVGVKHFASILSLALAAVGLVGALAPLAGTVVETLTGSYRALFFLCGLLSGLAAFLVLRGMGAQRQLPACQGANPFTHP